MANHRATKKDVRKASKRRESNRYYGKTTRNAIRDLKAIKEPKAAGEKMPEIASLIDRLAKKGIRFLDFYSGSTVCAPARCSFMTGRHTGHGAIRPPFLLIFFSFWHI